MAFVRDENTPPRPHGGQGSRGSTPGRAEALARWEAECLVNRGNNTKHSTNKVLLSLLTARYDPAQHFSRLNALLFTAMASIFIPTYCFAIP